MMEKHPVHVSAWLSVLVTVTSRVPTVAVAEIVMFAVTCDVSTKVVEFTVMPVPEKDATAPGKKFVPITETVVVTPCGLWSGDVDVTVGAAAVTVKQFEQLAGPPSPFTMLITQAPGATSVMSKSIDKDVVVLRVQFVPAISDCPVFVSFAVPEASKLRPVNVSVMGLVLAAELGVELTIEGLGLTVKHAAQLPDPRSGLVTVMLPAPVVALEETLITTSISPLEMKFVD
ncbi:MAG: hypothetical protein E6H53_17625 [Betaproteobacteria bacterium]|nr:MAG: hypothetical protein E6H53_17625 [Betaproteobacteria bacterium]